MRYRRKKCVTRYLALLTALVWAAGLSSMAQIQLETLTVSALPADVTFELAPSGAASGSSPVTITTTWMLLLRSTLTLYASFSSSTAALSDGAGHSIASAQVLGQMTTGNPVIFTAFTQTAPFGAPGGGLKLFTQGLGIVNLTSSRTDDLALRIDLSSTPAPAAGVYIGTLNLQAQAL